jgi:hypothetical protein
MTYRRKPIIDTDLLAVMAFALSMGLLVNALKADERIAQLEARVPELEAEIAVMRGDGGTDPINLENDDE